MTYANLLLEGGPQPATFLQCEHFIDYCGDHDVFGDNYVVMVCLLFSHNFL